MEYEINIKRTKYGDIVWTITFNTDIVWAGVKRIHTRSENGVEQEREMLCLTEQGLYFFLGRSDKKAALPYQMWIAGDVVPSIRKHGFYATPSTVEDILKNPDNFIQVLQAFKEIDRRLSSPKPLTLVRTVS